MCDRPKIHVFLGAPPPSSGPFSVSQAGVESERRPPARWRHLELTWTDGHLRPATEEARKQARLSGEEEGTSREDVEVDPTTPNLRDQDDQTNTNLDDAGWTTKASQGQEEQAGSSCNCNTEKDLCPDDHRPVERFMSQDEESDPEKEDQSSASVLEYLDSCFPAAQPEQEQSQHEPEPPCCSKHQSSPAASPLSVRTQYLTTWTLSQALVLRGRRGAQSPASPEKTLLPQTPTKHTQTPPSISSSTPELFSPLTPSPGASAELFSQPCSTPSVEEGGVVLEATTDGVLCSQVAESTTALDSPTKSPNFKKARISEDSRSEASSDSTTVSLQGPTTLLVRCYKPGVRYSVLVAVVHPCHLKEIKVKSGPSAGTYVPLASMVVTDQSDVEMKVVLWRRAAFWALTVSPGDILLITGLQVNEDRWRGETVLQSTFSSKLLSLGQITASTSPPAPQHVNVHTLSSLYGFLRERRPLLVSLPPHPLQDLNRLPYATLRSLRVNTLVHALLRVTHTHISSVWRNEAESRSRSAVQLKAVLNVEQPNGQQGALLLWGAAVDWLPRFKRDRAAVWDFHVLLVREGLTFDLPELHSTPWSSVQPLDPTDRRMQDFLPSRHNQKRNSSSISSLELDLDTLLSQKYSGDVELRVQVIGFRFQDAPPSQNATQPLLDSSTQLDGILEALSGDVTYTGCGRCSAELNTDTNGIYGPCYPCLPHTTVRRYYRPAVLTVSGQGSSQVCVQVPPVPLQNILDAPPDKLHRSSAPGSQVKHIQVAAERIQTLLSLPRKTFVLTIRSHFLCDENSFPLSQDFTLLDLQFPS
ncbi:LOW QUALITY PROTEIN: shieldin complex subunit 2 [Lates calcarifer]|uniref:LOW QUALITY PROTEIN: shieldin complex subunit 2 n=1 Tax=Lates calcarifer TaxID=8187 RepID=A0AAJ7VEV3_LATCA|nr:LOW QUALITY PROTEIN: shieldin complex subunit 2 [Lates calcarifer]